ncbi:MAG: TlpA disulfide reductase family protein [bacterium]|nr:TlpA disulfide reductase family protein [bacterium]
MKRRLLLVLAVGFALAAIGIGWSATKESPKGKKGTGRAVAAEFELKDLDGNLVRLSDFEGQVRIVDFWATWCPPCRAEIPHFRALYEKYKDQGVAVIGISLDRGGVDVVREFVNREKVNYPTVMGDAKTVKAYGNVQSIPTTFVIDQDGRIYRKYVGYRDQDVFEEDIKVLLNILATGKRKG